MTRLREETRIIDGLEISIVQRDCFAQAEIWEKLIHLIGPAGAHLGDVTNLNSLMSSDVSDLITAFGVLGGQLAGAEGRWIKNELLKTGHIIAEGQRHPLNEQTLRVSVTELTTLYKIYAFALEVNFRNFISAVRDLMSKGGRVLENQKVSQST